MTHTRSFKKKKKKSIAARTGALYTCCSCPNFLKHPFNSSYVISASIFPIKRVSSDFYLKKRNFFLRKKNSFSKKNRSILKRRGLFCRSLFQGIIEAKMMSFTLLYPFNEMKTRTKSAQKNKKRCEEDGIIHQRLKDKAPRKN